MRYLSAKCDLERLTSASDVGVEMGEASRERETHATHELPTEGVVLQVVHEGASGAVRQHYEVLSHPVHCQSETCTSTMKYCTVLSVWNMHQHYEVLHRPVSLKHAPALWGTAPSCQSETCTSTMRYSYMLSLPHSAGDFRNYRKSPDLPRGRNNLPQFHRNISEKNCWSIRLFPVFSSPNQTNCT